MRLVPAAMTLSLVTLGCTTERVILQAPPASDVRASASPMRVEPIVEQAADPLPIDGENLQFIGVADTLGKTIARAIDPWARRHVAQRPGGWELKVQLEESRAYDEDSRRTVELATRVTLTGTEGQVYLAQTHGYCKQSELRATPPAQVVYACMESMARDLAGWLDGVSP